MTAVFADGPFIGAGAGPRWGFSLQSGAVCYGLGWFFGVFILRVSRTVERAFPGELQLKTWGVRCLGGCFSQELLSRYEGGDMVIECHSFLAAGIAGDEFLIRIRDKGLWQYVSSQRLVSWAS